MSNNWMSDLLSIIVESEFSTVRFLANNGECFVGVVLQTQGADRSINSVSLDRDKNTLHVNCLWMFRLDEDGRPIPNSLTAKECSCKLTLNIHSFEMDGENHLVVGTGSGKDSEVIIISPNKEDHERLLALKGELTS